MSKSLETKLRELPGVSVRGVWYVELAALVEHLKAEAEAAKEEAKPDVKAPSLPKRDVS